jgi:hypothetical protein
VEVAHEMKDAASGRRGDSHLLATHDDVLVQCRRKRRTSLLTQPLGTSDSHRLVGNGHTILDFELPEGAEERGNFDERAPVFLPKKPSRDASQGLPYFWGSRSASA